MQGGAYFTEVELNQSNRNKKAMPLFWQSYFVAKNHHSKLQTFLI